MKKNLFLVFSFWFMVFCFLAADVFADPLMIQKAREAQKMLELYEMSFETAEIKTPIMSKKTKKIIGYKKETKVVGKPIFLIVWDNEEDVYYDLALMARHPVKCSNYDFRVLTPGFKVEHVKGCGIGRIVFNVWKDEKKLIVLASKHFWIPPELSGVFDQKILADRAQIGIYTSYSDDLYDKESLKEGYKFLSQRVDKVFAELEAKQVVSRVLPGRLLAKAHTMDYLLNLPANEQMDHGKFDRDAERTADEVLIEYAYNRDEAFRWSVSSADARGSFQFTNGRKGNGGTYDAVVKNYEDADIIPDFEAGTQDLENMIKIALCLVDMELAKFPLDAHKLYEEDYRRGAIFSSAAYNGGYGTAIALYNWIKKNNYEITLDNFNPSIQAFTYIKYEKRYVKTKEGKRILKKTAVKVVNTETWYYLKKQMYLWGYLDRLKEYIERGN